MGTYNNDLVAANAARQQEKAMLMRGKTPEQQRIIEFFYNPEGGCFGSSMTVQQYQEKVAARRAELPDTKQMALRKLGIDEEEVQEIDPVSFEGYVFNNKVDNLVAQATTNTWVSSEYMITWLFFGEKELFIYQYSFSMISDSKKENTMQYFYQDVTNFTAVSETYQKIVSVPGGCMGNSNYMQASANVDEFKIVVPGDTLRCSMTPSDNTDDAIRGMRNKLREMKNH